MVHLGMGDPTLPEESYDPYEISDLGGPRKDVRVWVFSGLGFWV